MALQIWLLNPYKLRYNWTELCSQVSTLMEPVVKLYDSNKKNKVKFGAVLVNNKYTLPLITPKDLAIYIVPTPDYGFIGVDFGKMGRRRDAAGLTLPSGGQSCSEAYVGDQEISGTNGELILVDTLEKPDPADPKGVFVNKKEPPMYLAKTIYHELMHYVTPKWSEEGLHTHPGVRLGKTLTTGHESQSEEDIKILADHLTSHDQKFWTGAWDALRGRGFKL